MIQPTNKNDFIFKLHEQLYKLGVKDCGDIISDFEHHFEQGKNNGLSEKEVCEKLGDIKEIALQYVTEDEILENIKEKSYDITNEEVTDEDKTKNESSENVNQTSTQNTDNNSFENQNQYYNYNQSYNNYEAYKKEQGTSTGNKISRLVGLILIDLLVFTWAIPTLFSLIVAYTAVAFSFVAAAGSAIILSVFNTSAQSTHIYSLLNFDFSGMPIAPVIFIILILLSGGVAMCCGIGAAWKGFVKVCIRIVNWHIDVIKNLVS